MWPYLPFNLKWWGSKNLVLTIYYHFHLKTLSSLTMTCYNYLKSLILENAFLRQNIEFSIFPVKLWKTFKFQKKYDCFCQPHLHCKCLQPAPHLVQDRVQLVGDLGDGHPQLCVLLSRLWQQQHFRTLGHAWGGQVICNHHGYDTNTNGTRNDHYHHTGKYSSTFKDMQHKNYRMEVIFSNNAT